MAIYDSNSVESFGGFQKEIDKAGLEMVLDNLQVNQYQYPIESTVREVASNAVDAVKEKQIAIEILSGRAKAEDYYLQRDEAVYQSSNFNASYFDLAWLNHTNHQVEIIYEEGDQINTKDKIRFLDPGVGLGGKRLEGYFKLSWSSKRNSRDALGKFGIGAKSPLSTGVDSYRMISRYNGREFIFDIYSHKVDSAIGKFNEDGTTNDFYEFENGFKAYYRTTNEKNGTEVVLETKKHHRQKYIDAVKSQLLYFKSIQFTVIREDRTKYEVNVKAGILYEDDDIILSDNTQFSKPHLVIGRAESRVNYGYIDFLELELENKAGNIGIKVASEDVAINPSRESVIWNDVTRKTVTEKFEKVVDIATNLIQDELKETVFVNWLDKCAQVLNVGSSMAQNSVIGRLSRIIDRSALKPKFLPEPSITYQPIEKMFPGMSIRVVSIGREYDSKTGKNKEKITRNEVVSWSEIVGKDIYIAEGSASHTKDMFLLKTKNTSFVMMKVIEDDVLKDLAAKSKDVIFDKVIAKREKTKDLLVKSDRVNSYEEIVVPEDWAKKIEEAEAENIIVKAPVLTPAEKRALEERLVMSTIRYESFRMDGKLFAWEKKEPKLKDVQEWDGTVVYGYGTKEDEEMLHFLGTALKDLPQFKTTDGIYFWKPDFKIVRIAQSMKKHFKGYTHIKDFFVQLQDKTLTMNDLMVKWHTARRIHEELNRLPFLNNFSTFNADIADEVVALKKFRDTYFTDMAKYQTSNKFGCTDVAYKSLCAGADAIAEFQLFVDRHKDEEGVVSDKAKAMFQNPNIEDARAVDLDLYKRLMTVVEYAEPIKVLFNRIDVLVTEGNYVSYELEQEIKAVMSLKGVN